MRVDFNVPMAPETTRISDDSRIRESLPTIRYLRERQARVILCCHFGRPKGRVVEEMRLAPVRKRLGELLELDVLDAAGPGGGEPASRTMGMGPGAWGVAQDKFQARSIGLVSRGVDGED